HVSLPRSLVITADNVRETRDIIDIGMAVDTDGTRRSARADQAGRRSACCRVGRSVPPGQPSKETHAARSNLVLSDSYAKSASARLRMPAAGVARRSHPG